MEEEGDREREREIGRERGERGRGERGRGGREGGREGGKERGEKERGRKGDEGMGKGIKMWREGEKE